MSKQKISVITIALNEESMIEDCLKSVAWADELILLDGGSTDKTLQIAEKYQAKVFPQEVKEKDWASWHNQGKDEALGDWIFYLDADERITPELQKEIMEIMKNKNCQSSAFAVPRRNVLLGRPMSFGGWYPDYQIRLFKKEKLVKWQGKLHERPIFKGTLGYLKNPMFHLTHRDLSSMVGKTILFSNIEVQLLYQAGHPPVVWWRILKVMSGEFFDHFVKKQAWRDGTVGWIEGLFQVFNKFLIYARLWEKQQVKK
jgi:glycosyltransferase involved in cell wall biosynthesis